MRILCYVGQSVVSDLIKGFTRSIISHCAVWDLETGAVFESVEDGFVKSDGIFHRHPEMPVVHELAFKRPLSAVQRRDGRRLLEKWVSENKGYDYKSVFIGFPTRANGDLDPLRFFCSEAVLAWSIAVGQPLQERMSPWRATPEDIYTSPLLKWVRTYPE